MKARILDPSEWDEINVGALPEVMKYCNPRDLDVVVVERDVEIVASVLFMRVPHFESLWIDPKHRGNAGVFRALIRQAFELPRAAADTWVLADAADEDECMRSICERLQGTELPRRFFALPVPIGV